MPEARAAEPTQVQPDTANPDREPPGSPAPTVDFVVAPSPEEFQSGTSETQPDKVASLIEEPKCLTEHRYGAVKLESLPSRKTAEDAKVDPSGPRRGEGVQTTAGDSNP